MHRLSQRVVPADYSRLDTTAFAPARMRNLTAAVVGVGALGDAVVRLLGMAGVGRLLLIDPDRVESSNLSRSILYRSPDAVGAPKVEAAARACAHLFPDTRVSPIPREIADVGLEDLNQADVLFGCLDSESARLELAYLATKVNKPVADAGLAAPGAGIGRASLFPSRRTACFGCGLRHSKRRELLETWDSAPLGCSPSSLDETGKPARGSTPTQAAIVAALQVEIALGDQEEAFALEMDAGFHVRRLALPQAALCPFHDAPARLLPVGEGMTFQQALDAARVPSPWRIPLDWPVALTATCRACGHSPPTPQRVDRLRRTPCPACGATAVEPSAVVRVITADGPDAARRPSDLGLPARHLYTVESLPQ